MAFQKPVEGINKALKTLIRPLRPLRALQPGARSRGPHEVLMAVKGPYKAIEALEGIKGLIPPLRAL